MVFRLFFEKQVKNVSVHAGPRLEIFKERLFFTLKTKNY